MNSDEFLKKQEEILDKCQKLLSAGKFSEYYEAFQEFIDLGDKFIKENSKRRKV